MRADADWMNLLPAIEGLGSYEWRPAEDRLVWSPELVRLYGLKSAPRTKNGFLAYVHPDDRVKVEAAMSSHLAEGASFCHRFRIVRPDGTVRHLQNRGLVERDSTGAVIRVRGVATDVTAVVAATVSASPLQNTHQAQFARFVEDAPVAMALFDRDMRYVAASPSYVDEYRLPPGLDLIGRSHYEVFPDMPQRWRGIHARVLDGETLTEDDDHFLRRDGRIDYVRWAMSPWRGPDGTVLGAILVSVVIPAGEKGARELEQTHRRVTSAVAVSGLGFGEVDYRAGTIDLNAEAARLLGLGDEALTASRREVHGTFHPDDLAEIDRRTALACDPAGDGCLDMEHRVVLPGGKVRWIRTRKRVTFGEVDGERVPVRATLTLLDVTERARMTQALRESEAFARGALEANPDCVFVLDPAGRVMFANGTVRARFREDWEPLLGRPWVALWEDRHASVLTAAIERAGSGRQAFTQLTCRKGDGRRVHWDVRIAPVEIAGRTETPLIVVCRDVTDQVEAERRIAESERRLREASAAAECGVFESDLVAGTQHWSPEMRRIIGMSPDEPEPPIGAAPSFVHPHDVRALLEAWRRVEAGDETFLNEHRIVRPDGSTRWVQMRGRVDRDACGRILRSFGTYVDVTDRKLTDRRLRESEARARAVLDQILAFAAVLDLDGTVRFVNQRPLDMAGVGLEEVLGRPFVETSWWAHDPAVRDRLRSAIERARRGRVVRYDEQVMTTHGLIWIDFNIAPLRGVNGRIVGLIPSAVEITERKRAEQDLTAARDTFAALVERSPFGIMTVDEKLRVAHLSEGARSAFEDPDAIIGQDFGVIARMAWPEEIARDILARFRSTLETGEPYRGQIIAGQRRDRQAVESYEWRLDRITLSDGRPGVVAHFYDLSERHRQEAHVRTLMGEVNHRSKNLLALVQSIARRTSADGRKAFLIAFEQRIRALAAAQDLLVDGDWKGVDLSALVRSQLAHFSELIDKRIAVRGPALRLSPQAAQTIGMAIHELTTNAAKYGALSTPEGRIEISWALADEPGAGRRLSMSWTESGGPPVEEPRRSGFGESVIKTVFERALTATVRCTYARDGFRWVMSCPVDAVTGADDPAPGSARPVARPDPSSKAIPILVVEDDPILSLDIHALLEEEGYAILGPVATVAEADALLDARGCACAMLDVNLGRETSEPIAARLAASGIPIIVMSSYPPDGHPAIFRSAPRLSKPVDPVALLRTLEAMLSGAARLN
jgi:PAS domain S-box-containing protein